MRMLRKERFLRSDCSDKFIANPPNSFDILVLRIDLVSQIFHRHRHTADVGIIQTPHIIKDLLPREHLAALIQKIAQQLKFPGSQGNPHSFFRRFIGLLIDFHITEPNHLG